MWRWLADRVVPRAALRSTHPGNLPCVVMGCLAPPTRGGCGFCWGHAFIDKFPFRTPEAQARLFDRYRNIYVENR